jgi:hypothetical protein
MGRMEGSDPVMTRLADLDERIRTITFMATGVDFPPAVAGFMLGIVMTCMVVALAAVIAVIVVTV